MYGKVLEYARGVSGIRYGHDGEVAAPRCNAGPPPRGAVRGREDGERRRRAQLRFVEERLRPLKDTPLARVYWQVREELDRLEVEGDAAGDDR